jgi:hypothetical protein
MTTLNLGVVVQPYRHEGYRRAGRRRGRNVKAAKVSSLTTFDVARILESKYHIMRHFYEHHAEEILKELQDSYHRATESMLMTNIFIDPSVKGIENIRKMFNRFIDEREVENIGIPGVPTMAALHGVSHRFDMPYAGRTRKKGMRRSSFYDTGLYENSFRAWID